MILRYFFGLDFNYFNIIYFKSIQKIFKLAHIYEEIESGKGEEPVAVFNFKGYPWVSSLSAFFSCFVQHSHPNYPTQYHSQFIRLLCNQERTRLYTTYKTSERFKTWKNCLPFSNGIFDFVNIKKIIDEIRIKQASRSSERSGSIMAIEPPCDLHLPHKNDHIPEQAETVNVVKMLVQDPSLVQRILHEYNIKIPPEYITLNTPVESFAVFRNYDKDLVLEYMEKSDQIILLNQFIFIY